MREIMRSLLSSNLLVTGILMFIGSIITFAGSTFLLNATNVGKRLGFLITGAAIFGWGVINSIFSSFMPHEVQLLQILMV